MAKKPTRQGVKRLRFRFSRGETPRLNPAELLLEHISDTQLLGSQAKAKALNGYHTKLFYELEGQRAAAAREIRAALQSVGGISVCINDWCRQVKCKYVLSPLSCVGSVNISGRFNYGNDLDARFPRFPAIYVAADRNTAHCEMFQISAPESGRLSAAELNFQSSTSIAAYSLVGDVNLVFDLTDPKNLEPFIAATQDFTLSKELRQTANSLGISPGRVANSAAELMTTIMDPNWRTYPMYGDIPANSQVLGYLLRDAGFEGVVYPSVRQPHGKAMAIFPENFGGSASKLRATGAPPEAQLTELSESTFREFL